MNSSNGFTLEGLDYLAFGAFFVVLSAVGYWAGRRERTGATEYFLAGKQLPWYVIGGSFIASNISTEHFIGMIGAACVYGVCVGMSEWMNVLSFSLLIWFFIPFLLASKVFTTPEFLERRFGPVLRQLFALVTIISNVVAFLAAVLYGGALAIQKLFSAELATLAGFLPRLLVPDGASADGVQLWLAIIILGIVAGFWAIYGGLSSVAWTDLFTVVVMVIGGTTVTILGLNALADGGSLTDGIKEMIARNQATEFLWEPAVSSNLEHLTGTSGYNRLSVFQPASHPTHPWPSLIFGVFSISIWYNVLNQFMIQRVLGARSGYDARMGIVLAGFLKVFLPVIVVVPGLILFALNPEILLQAWDGVRPEADQGYIQMLQRLVPVGLRGLFLAALFGAIQSTVNSVLNSTATIFTLDIYKRHLNRSASDKHLVTVGILSSIVVLAIAIVLGGFISRIGGSLFVYIQSLYAFFAPPFAAVFLLGILWKRINSPGALVAVLLGFAFGILMKVYVQFEGPIQDLAPFVPDYPSWLAPYANQAVLNWGFCVLTCIAVSLLTTPPPADRITDQVTVNWSKLNIFGDLGDRWYKSVITWWGIFVALIVAIFVLLSGLILPSGVDGTRGKTETPVEVTNIDSIVKSQSKLGETPVWHPREKCLYWADIDRGQLHRFDPAQDRHDVVLQGRPIGGITYQVDGALLLFRDRGTVDVYRDGQVQKTLISEIPDEVKTRFNDVIADPRGRVFCGTLKSGDRPGRLYRLDPDGSYRIVLEGIGCSNGLGFTRDLKRMYYTDSTAGTIWVFDYDVETGDLGNRQVFAKIEPPGLPDGLTVDDEDNVWSAIWNGSCVVCYRPDGSVKTKIELPTKKITSVMFGGPDMSDLYITSAGNDEASGDDSQAGNLFRITPGVRGRREFPSRIGIDTE